MRSTTSAASIRALADELAWLRRLARSLVRDSHLAEDAVQVTRLRALETSARPSAGSLRGWLAAVLRNRVRQERRSRDRRAARERLLPPADHDPSASSVVEDLELHRRLVGQQVPASYCQRKGPASETRSPRYDALHGIPTHRPNPGRERDVPARA